MEKYIKVNGVKLELTPEQVAALTAGQVKDDLFERRYNAGYYYIDYGGNVESDTDEEGLTDDGCYDVGNYCRDEEKMKQRALHETLDRLLWRYSEQHGGDPEWDGKNGHWNIFREPDNQFRCDLWASRKRGGPYFHSKEVAKAAIREVVEPFCKAHPEFVW